MNVFGLIWIFLILVILLKNNIKYMVLLTLFSMVIQCSNVITIGDTLIGPQVITNIAFIFMYTMKNFSMKIKKITRIEISALIVYLIVILSSLYNGTLKIHILRIIQLGIYILSFSLMAKLHDKIDENFIYDTVKKITIFVLGMGIIQILSTSGVIPRIPFISELFFNDRSTSVYYWREGYNRLSSVFMEASYCGCFLVGALFYFLSSWKKDRKNIFIIIMLIIEILLTKSSAAYVSLAICGVLFMGMSKNKKIKRILLPVSIMIIILIFVFGYEILDEVIFSKGLSGSATTRYYWNLNAMNSYKQSKLLGVGYKNLRASSIIYSLLGELGILGLVAYMVLNLQICMSLFKKQTYRNLSKAGARFSILAIIIAQIVACPDLDLCIYWMFMDFMALHGLKSISGEVLVSKEKN